MLNELHGDPALLRLEEADEEIRSQLDRERLHDDPSVDAELVDPKVRARYAAMERWDG